MIISRCECVCVCVCIVLCMVSDPSTPNPACVLDDDDYTNGMSHLSSGNVLKERCTHIKTKLYFEYHSLKTNEHRMVLVRKSRHRRCKHGCSVGRVLPATLRKGRQCVRAGHRSRCGLANRAHCGEKRRQVGRIVARHQLPSRHNAALLGVEEANNYVKCLVDLDLNALSISSSALAWSE